MEKWKSHIRAAIIGVVLMVVLNIGMVVWWAAKLDALLINAVTRAELSLRDERIKNISDAVKANKEELQRAEDKLDRINRLLTTDQQRSL
ncbi:MAG: hypothetical protein ACI8WB_003628 [Phenylobacterium sp.]|jgi:hypothetical protein